MTNIDLVPVKSKKTKRKPGTVRTKRVRANDSIVTLRAIDANSASFVEDLSYVFRQNVAKARKENRKLFGSADRVGKKR